jgi:8-oxo-dGTP diphosphatase
LIHAVEDEQPVTTPADTADIVLLADRDGIPCVLVIQRADDSDAFPGYRALPGGYRENGETSEQAARRELLEETGIHAPVELRHVGRYDTPGRDPSGPVASDVYVGTLPEAVQPHAGDDAQDAGWLPVALLLAEPTVLAFDHAKILRDATT